MYIYLIIAVIIFFIEVFITCRWLDEDMVESISWWFFMLFIAAIWPLVICVGIPIGSVAALGFYFRKKAENAKNKNSEGN